jgi:hypothetical protein
LKNRRILISLNSVFSFFLSRVSNFAVQKAGSGFSSRGWNILRCSGRGILRGGGLGISAGSFLGRLWGGQGDGGPSFSLFRTEIVNLRKTKKTNYLQVQKSCLKAPHPRAHESVVMTPQCMQGPSVILPLGVLGESWGKMEGEISNLGVVEPSLSFFSFLGPRSGRQFPIWLLQVTQIKEMLLSYYNNEKKYLIVHSNIHIIIAHQYSLNQIRIRLL